MELWFVLAIIVTLLWGSAAILAKLSTPKLGVARVAVLIIVVEGAMYFLGFLYWHENVPISAISALLAATSSILGAVAYLCFFESIVDGQIAIAGTISAAYPALTVIGALLLLSETLTSTQAVGLVAIIGGIVALSYEPNPGSQHATPKRSVFFALLAFVLWGIWGLTSKMAIDAVGPGSIFGFYVVSSCVVPLAYIWFRRIRPASPKSDGPSRIAWAFGTTGMALNVFGVLAFSFALNVGLASLVVPISSAYPLVTVILAVVLLREKLSRHQITALAFVIIGIIMIGITG